DTFGPYEARIYVINSGGTPPPPATLTVSPTSVTAGGSVSGTWSAIAGPTGLDWIGLYAVGASDTAYLAWVYVSCAQAPGSAKAAGACPVGIPSTLPPGTYELRLLANNGYTRLATGNPLTVSSSGPTLGVSPTAVTRGATVTATWSGITSPTKRDWIGL